MGSEADQNFVVGSVQLGIAREAPRSMKLELSQPLGHVVELSRLNSLYGSFEQKRFMRHG